MISGERRLPTDSFNWLDVSGPSDPTLPSGCCITPFSDDLKGSFFCSTRVSIDPCKSELNITLQDHVTIKETIDLEFKLAIEQDNKRYRVYNTGKTPVDNGVYFDCNNLNEAKILIKKLNKLDNTEKWVWA